MADPQKVYLDDQGNPIAKTYLDDQGNPIGGAAPAQTPAERLSAVSNEEPGTFRGGFVQSLKDQVGEAFAGARPMLEGAAHPASAEDFASLLIPSTALGTGLRSLRGYVGAAKNLASGAAEGAANRAGLKKLPAVMRSMYQTATDTLSGGDRAFQNAPLAQQMEGLPPTPAPTTTRAAGPPMSTFNPNDAPLAQQMEHLPETPAPMAGSLRMTSPRQLPQTPFNELPLYQQMEQLTERPGPERVRFPDPRRPNLGAEDPASAAAMPSRPAQPAPKPAAARALTASEQAALAERYPGMPIDKLEAQLQGTSLEAPPAQAHPYDPSRKDIGAAKTGRLVGKTKQEVRDVATPIVGEAQGEASPILPEGALRKIIDTMKALPPGAEREAYVARATSGKARGQIENIRRTLEHLGLLVGATTGVDALVRQRLHAAGSDTRPTAERDRDE